MARHLLRTRLCDILGIEYPILSAGMGPALIGEATGAPVELVVAVSEAGGCGVLGAAAFSLDELRKNIRKIKSMTNKPFGVDLLLPKNLPGRSESDGLDETSSDTSTKLRFGELLKTLPDRHRRWVERIQRDLDLPDVELTFSSHSCLTMSRAAVRICLEERVPLFCAGLGSPGFMLEEARKVGTKVLAITGNVKNARRMVEEGIDLLVAQGHEGGGHTGRIGTMALVPQVLDVAGEVPVLAAGGIGDGRGLAASLAMGCVGVWVGTRFLATDEGGALPINKNRILQATDEDTVVTRCYTGKTARINRNLFHQIWDESELEPLPFPSQVLISSALLTSLTQAGKDEYIGGFAGQISGMIDEIKPAAQVLEQMVEAAIDIFKRKIPQQVKLDER